MLKRLALLVWPLLIAAIILMARFDKDYASPGESYGIKCVQQDDSSSAPATLSCAIGPVQKASRNENEPVWWHKLIAWPEGITAWLLLFTLGGIVWQAWETRKAAEASGLQVEISRKAFISQFKPRITISAMWLIDKDVHLAIEIWLTNKGHTQGRIDRSHVTIAWDVPSEPSKKRIISSTSFKQASLGPGSDQQTVIDIAAIRGPFDIGRIAVEEYGRDQESWIYCFGYLNYVDDSGISRNARFYRKYNMRSRRFIPSEDPEEEHAD